MDFFSTLYPKIAFSMGETAIYVRPFQHKLPILRLTLRKA